MALNVAEVVERARRLEAARGYHQRISDAHRFKIGRNIEFVVAANLCTGCATCYAACPEGAIQITYQDGKGVHEPIVDHSRCTECSVCVAVCPGFELNLSNPPHRPVNPRRHGLIGPYTAIRRAFTTDDEVRDRAASGGMITKTLEHLLDTGGVDGALVTRMSKRDPLDTETYIARSRSDLQESQKSHYCPAPVNRALRDIIWAPKPGERYAYMGLPTHVHGLRFLQQVFPDLREQIRFVFSSFTAHMPTRHATEFMLWANRIPLHEVTAIEYRGGSVPGRCRVNLTRGRVREIPHLHWTYYGHAFPNFFYPLREWTYHDKLSQWADISMGDNWQKWIHEPRGASTVVTRSEEAETLMEEVIASGKAVATVMRARDLVKDQVLLKKCSIQCRYQVWQERKRPVPIYPDGLFDYRKADASTRRFADRVEFSSRRRPWPLMYGVIRFDYWYRKRLPEIPQAIRARRWVWQNRLCRMADRLKEVVRLFLPAPPRTRPRRPPGGVVTIGGYGYRDIGDEAMPHADILYIRQQVGPNIGILMLSPDPAYTKAFHGEDSQLDVLHLDMPARRSRSDLIHWMLYTGLLCFGAVLTRSGIRIRLWGSARTLLDALADSAVLLNVGGGNLNSIIPSELYKKCATYLAARCMGKPVILSGQTIGPFLMNVDRRVARFALNRTQLITFRDQAISRQRLAEIGVCRPKMQDAADDAIDLPYISRSEAAALIEREVGRPWAELANRPVVFLNLKASLNLFKTHEGVSNLDREVRAIAKLADHMVEQHGVRIVFLPTDYCGASDDRVVHEQAMRLVRHPADCFALNVEYTDCQLKGLLALPDFAMGARYHFCVFAAGVLTPFMGVASGLYQRTKLKGLALLSGLPECYLDSELGEMPLETLTQHASRLFEDRARIRAILAKSVPHMTANSRLAVNEVIKIVRSAQPSG